MVQLDLLSCMADKHFGWRLKVRRMAFMQHRKVPPSLCVVSTLPGSAGIYRQQGLVSNPPGDIWVLVWHAWVWADNYAPEGRFQIANGFPTLGPHQKDVRLGSSKLQQREGWVYRFVA